MDCLLIIYCVHMSVKFTDGRPLSENKHLGEIAGDLYHQIASLLVPTTGLHCHSSPCL